MVFLQSNTDGTVEKEGAEKVETMEEDATEVEEGGKEVDMGENYPQEAA